MPLLTLKNEIASCLPAKLLYLEIAENCNLGQANFDKVVGNSGEQRRGALLHREKGGVGKGCCDQNVHGRKPEVLSIVASHWLNHDCFSLAGAVARQGENLPSYC